LGIILNKIFFTAFILLLSFFQTSAQERAKSAPVPLTAGVDWIYLATCGLYSKWEAEGNDVFSSFGIVGMKPQFGSPADNGTAWSTGTDSANVNKIFFLGPHYSQYIIHVFKNEYNDDNLVSYAAFFRLRTKINPADTVPVCRISAVLRDTDQNVIGTLDEQIIYSNKLGPDYVNFRLLYDYADFFNPVKGYSKHGQRNPHRQRNIETKYIDFNQKVHFQIEWFGNYELVFDYVEVYDEKIFDTWFLDPCNYDILVKNIERNNAKFSFHPEKYYHTFDELYSLDVYEAVRRTQHILDSLNLERDIIREYFPHLSLPAIAGDKNRQQELSGEAQLHQGKIIIKND
jgi:hypothetical protein